MPTEISDLLLLLLSFVTAAVLWLLSFGISNWLLLAVVVILLFGLNCLTRMENRIVSFLGLILGGLPEINDDVNIPRSVKDIARSVEDIMGRLPILGIDMEGIESSLRAIQTSIEGIDFGDLQAIKSDLSSISTTLHRIEDYLHPPDREAY